MRPNPTYTIYWWRSKRAVRDPFRAHVRCDQNGEIVWAQSEGLTKKSEVLRRIDDLFGGRWPVREKP